jgi:hypothetical protein
MSAWAQVCGDGGQIVSNGGSLLCVNGSAGTRPYGSHTYDGVGAPSSGGYTKPSKPRVLASKYGAIALNMKGAGFDSTYGETSETEAKRNALAKCGSTCKIIASYWNTCAAVGWGTRKNRTFYPIVYSTQKSTIESKVLAKCKAEGGRNCKIMMPAECSLPQ